MVKALPNTTRIKCNTVERMYSNLTKVKSEENTPLITCENVDVGYDLWSEELTANFWDVLKSPVTTLLRILSDRLRYEQSLSILKHSKISKEGMMTKTSIMLGLGATDDELKEAMDDLRAIDVDILTLGQYLQPTSLHLTVKEYVAPAKFAFWKEYGEAIGFRYVASGPLWDGKTVRVDERAIGLALMARTDIGVTLKWVNGTSHAAWLSPGHFGAGHVFVNELAQIMQLTLVRSSYRAGELFAQAMVKERSKSSLSSQ
ncbi:hypothetical protein Cgig2_033092 [Carnegiea gigantea]|uniref:Lipoyl synthase n=1 Tax=Carnegiea gigantea TaxID=171969 RepID=A0A9Q1GTI3_9CARY|nr:hypothetical protein Cgig2_033092 [Carnegiea gigantea]